MSTWGLKAQSTRQSLNLTISQGLSFFCLEMNKVSQRKQESKRLISSGLSAAWGFTILPGVSTYSIGMSFFKSENACLGYFLWEGCSQWEGFTVHESLLTRAGSGAGRTWRCRVPPPNTEFLSSLSTSMCWSYGGRVHQASRSESMHEPFLLKLYLYVFPEVQALTGRATEMAGSRAFDAGIKHL